MRILEILLIDRTNGGIGFGNPELSSLFMEMQLVVCLREFGVVLQHKARTLPCHGAFSYSPKEFQNLYSHKIDIEFLLQPFIIAWNLI